jgi:thioredoxin-dependent peroxiredoxin
MKIGDRAPDFTLKDGDGNNWKLSDQKGKTVVLLFYPGDNTPICTKQLCSVRDNWTHYAATGATVVGISTDSVDSHKGFAEKHNLPLTLLADETGEVVEKYAVKSWLPGRAARAVVVVDKSGMVRYHKTEAVSLFRPKDDDILTAIAQANAV